MHCVGLGRPTENSPFVVRKSPTPGLPSLVHQHLRKSWQPPKKQPSPPAVSGASKSYFRKVPGVVSTRAGYTAGTTASPTYEQVCTGRTGHAEAVEITFDPSVVTYAALVDLFYENHDPTTLDRQGPDVGTQYRSGIYFHSPQQEQIATAETEKRQASGDYARPIVTEILPAETFYSAEEYHQKYFAHRGVNWSCHSGNGKRLQRKARRPLMNRISKMLVGVGPDAFDAL